MTDKIYFKDYIGSVEYSKEDDIFHGIVLGIDSVISYEGSTLSELETDFKGAVECYLDSCKRNKITPEKSFLN